MHIDYKKQFNKEPKCSTSNVPKDNTPWLYPEAKQFSL